MGATATADPAPAPPRRREYACSECGVRQRRLDGGLMDRAPAAWVRSRGGWTCLACVRLAARNGGGDELGRLVDAELRRGASVNDVARSTGADALAVRKRRMALVRAGEVRPPSKRPRQRRDPTAPTLEALRRLGESDADAIVLETGGTHSTVCRHLRALAEGGRVTSRQKGSGKDSRKRFYKAA